MIVENINMQMESESVDLIDRRLMSLYGIVKKPVKVKQESFAKESNERR